MEIFQTVMIHKRYEESLILGLITLGERLKKRRDIICQNLGISTQQWLILLHLANDPNIEYIKRNKHKKPLLASELAESLNVSRPNITNLINILLEKELVEQVEDKDDKRRKRLTLSEKGTEVLDSLQPHREILNGELFGSLTSEQKANFLSLVEQTIGILDDYK
jgi:DNA-binding MarR family transcriptional regulator